MKKTSLFLLSAIILSGCAPQGEDAKETTKNAQTAKAQEPAAKETPYVPNPQVPDDRQLKKPGDSYSDRKGELTLKAAKSANKEVAVGNLKYTITDVKLLHYVPDYSMIDYFHHYTHEEEFDFVKVGVKIENQSNQTYHFAPVAMLKVNDSIQRTWEEDFYLEELNGEIAPGQVKQGSLGFIVDDLDSISELEILSGDLVDEKEKKVNAPVRITIK